MSKIGLFNHSSFSTIFFTIVLYVSTLHQTQAQNFQSDYDLIRCKGAIPAELKLNASEQLNKNKSELGDLSSTNAKKRKVQEEFLSKSTLSLSALVGSGRVLYGDTVTAYIRKVGNEILETTPELKGKVQFFAFKSPTTNAFCTHEGNIFVTLQMIQRIKSEAELAFVLSHEVSHYLLKHLIKDYSYRKETIEKLRTKKNYVSIDNVLQIGFSRSKESELQADSLGYILFSKTKYNKQSYQHILNLFATSGHPPNEHTFSKTFFQWGKFEIPNCFFLDTLDEIEQKWEENDLYKTHPNNKKRKDKLDAFNMQSFPSNTAQQNFIHPESEFLHIQKIAKFENALLLVNANDYTKAFYAIYNLLETYPQNKFLNKLMIKVLYGLAIYKNKNRYYHVGDSYTDYGGQTQQVNYFFKQLTAKQLSGLALRKIMELRNRVDNARFVDTLCIDLMTSAMIEEGVDLDGFSKNDPAMMDFETKIKLASADKKMFPAKKRYMCRDLYSYVLYDEKNTNPELGRLFRMAMIKVIAEKMRAEMGHKARMKSDKSAAKQLQKEGYLTAGHNIVILEPWLQYTAKEQEERLLKDKSIEADFHAKLKNYLGTNCPTATLLSTQELKKENSDFYNKASFFNSWIREYAYQHFKVDAKVLQSDLIRKYYPKDRYLLFFQSSYRLNITSLTLLDIETGIILYHGSKNSYSSKPSVLLSEFDKQFKKINKK